MAYDTPKAAHFEAYDVTGDPITPEHNSLWDHALTLRWRLAFTVQDTVTGNMLAITPGKLDAIQRIIDKHNASSTLIEIRLTQSIRDIAERKGA